MFEDLQGQIERITFHNEENGFTIARLKVKGFRELVTAVGNLMAPVPGQVLQATGEWKTHAQFGEQFKIVRYKSLVPATVAGIEKYPRIWARQGYRSRDGEEDSESLWKRDP